MRPGPDVLSAELLHGFGLLDLRNLDVGYELDEERCDLVPAAFRLGPRLRAVAASTKPSSGESRLPAGR